MKALRTALLLALVSLPLATAPYSSAQAQPLVSSNTTVVLLVGLPGDLPSEQAYRAQLESWLRWLSEQAPKPKQAIVFWDTEPFPTQPDSLPVRFLPSRRHDFLEAARQLPPSSSLLLVAWGHGGQQRGAPVFHVRGPRILASDMQDFLSEAAPSNTGLILMFPGSGSFAKALAKEDRWILASENEVTFQSDPIGMDLLLRGLRAGIEIDALAKDFGRATSDWYESRQLARTEEPTLWRGPATPKVLAPPSQPASATEAETKEEQPRPAAPVIAGLPWQEIEPVAAADYPAHEGVILKQELNYVLAQQPAVVAETEFFIQILNAQGLHLADFNFSSSPPDEELDVLEAEIRLPDGNLLRLDPSDIHESVIGAELGYPGQRQKFFSLPGAAPEAILHVRYRSTWKQFPMPSVSLQVPLPDELPVEKLAIQVEVPREQPLHFHFTGLDAPNPTVTQRQYGTRYRWSFSKLKPPPDEPFSVPNRSPLLLLSTWRDWGSFAGWYDRISRLSDTITPEITTTAQSLTAGLSGDDEKIRAIYDYVTGLRYVAVPLGVNSFRPHAAANVLKNQFGDCKDKANLFNAMLRTLNFDAKLVLVPRFAQAYEDLPGLAFNHAISRVVVSDRTVWIDTTDDLCRFGLLPPGDPGRSVLVIDGQSTKLTLLPHPQPGDHKLELRGQIDLNPITCPATWSATAFGYEDYALRSAARQSAPGALTPLLDEEFDIVTSIFVSGQQQFSPFADLSTNFTWTASGQCLGLLIPLPTTNQFLLRFPAWLPAGWAQTLPKRTGALHLNEGYPLGLEQEIRFQLGAGSNVAEASNESYLVASLPPAQEGNDKPLQWQLHWSQPTPNTMLGQLRVELSEGQIDDIEAFQTSLKSLLQTLMTAGPVLERLKVRSNP